MILFSCNAICYALVAQLGFISLVNLRFQPTTATESQFCAPMINWASLGQSERTPSLL